jgi:hypothetical protein
MRKDGNKFGLPECSGEDDGLDPLLPDRLERGPDFREPARNQPVYDAVEARGFSKNKGDNAPALASGLLGHMTGKLACPRDQPERCLFAHLLDI